MTWPSRVADGKGRYCTKACYAAHASTPERLARRFFSKVDKSGPEGVHSQTGASLGPCWMWLAGKDEDGYGSFRSANSGRAHRASYEQRFGAIPEGLDLDHLCRNRACVNPEHLEPVTPVENNRRSPMHGSNQTHCKAGHLFDEANTRFAVRPGGTSTQRQCIACNRAACLRYNRKRPLRIRAAG